MYYLVVVGLILIVLSSIAGIVGLLIFGGTLIENLDFDLRQASHYKKSQLLKARKEYLKEALKDVLKWGIPTLLTCAMMSVCIPLGVSNLNTYRLYSYEKILYEIVSLERSNNVEGSFFLGSGHVDSVEYYYFYTPTNKGYKLEKKSHDRTYIVEDDSTTPCLKAIKEVNAWNEYYVLIVPTNTIIREFHA